MKTNEELEVTVFVILGGVGDLTWRLLMPVLDVWVAPPNDFPNCSAGTWGPEDAQKLLAQGHSWPMPTELAGQGKKEGKKS